MSDINFEQLLAAHNEEFRAAEEFGNDWMPDVGKGYVVLLTKCKTGTSDKDGELYAWWRITGHIENVADAEQHGKDFCVGWYKQLIPGLAKGAARVLNAGQTVNDWETAHKLFSECPGTLVYVDIRKTHSKKTDQNYFNSYMISLIDVADGEDEIVEPPQSEAVSAEDTESVE